MALAFVVLEIVSAFFIEAPVVAIVFAVLFLVGWLVLRRGGVVGVIIMLVLCAIELLGIPFYEREDTDDWILQGVALVLSVLGLVAGTACLRRRSVATSAA